MRTSAMFVVTLLGILTLNMPHANGYNILVTVLGISGSQNLIMYRLAEILAKRGNDVTILKKELFKESKTPKIAMAKEVVHKMMEDTPEKVDEIRKLINSVTWGSSASPASFYQLMNILRPFVDDCDVILKKETLMQQLKANKYDVVIIHMMDFCSFGMAHHLGIEGTIWMSTAFAIDPMAWYAGMASPASYVVSAPHPVTDRMNFVQRAQNLFYTTAVNAVVQFGLVRVYNNIFQEQYGSNFPTFGELLYKTQLYFINSDPFFEYPRPLSPNVVYVGGLTMKNAEPLTEEWEKIVNESEHGVVVFSLGSIVNTSFMPIEMKRAFTNAFSKIPQKVIWRLEGDRSIVKNIPNIVATDWLPQKDLLGHPNVKAFITHGGYNSLTEATYLGVPLLMFPMMGDQYANCKRVERLNVGFTLDKDDLTEQSILDAINKITSNDEIQANARRLGRMIRNKPVSSYDLAVNWVEFLAEFKNVDQLKPAGNELSLIEYFLVDVLTTIFLSLILLFYVIFKLCQFSKRCCCGAEVKSKKD